MDISTPKSNNSYIVTPKKSIKINFISVIIPVYKDVIGLERTLTSLRRQTISITNYEIIVCNDGGDERVGELCNKYSVKEIIISQNKGSYNARNRGIEEAAGDYLAFVDADITVPEHWLECGLKALQSADYVGGPVIINEEEASSPAHYYELVTGFKDNELGYTHQFYVTANLFVKRSVFEHIGGFDERLRSGGDNEFGNRVYLAGIYRQNFNRELAVIHPPRGFNSIVKKRVRITEGKMMLNNLYPERYRYEFSSPINLILRLPVPPSIPGVIKTYKKNKHFGFLSYYLFVWRLKIRVTMKLLPILLQHNRIGK
jgi:glycosyltransferase AglI